ncbi:MAG: hypothetical protein RL226_2065 [Bacteroidota bacterium]|jgi:hypothetical protein
MMKRAILLCAILPFLSINLSSQTFNNVAEDLGISAVVSGLFGAGVSFADFDGDGLDDLTFAVSNAAPKVYKNNNGSFTLMNFQFAVMSDPKAIFWVDYDNDGDNDFFATVRNGSNQLYRNNGNNVFTNISNAAGIGLPGQHNYGASWGDYDLDGDLDLYVCQYAFSTEPGTPDMKNHLFRNDGNDVFTDVTAIAGVAGNVDLSFQSAWFDYNNDQYPDLYVINDKVSPNRMYRNNGDGTFTEVTNALNLGIIIDSMSASIADFNNDHLMDFYSTNTQEGNILLKGNANLSHTDVTAEHNLIVYDYTWAAVWFDMDNDTDLDMFIAEAEALAFNSPNYLFRNTGEANGYVYEDVSDLLLTPDNSDAYVAASGDLQNDGHLDLVVNNRSPYNTVIWENTGNNDGNGYVKVLLEGTTSNRQGIGSWITVYAGEHSYLTYTFMGENYLGQNSFSEHFGIGQHTQADSIHIEWPSGVTDTFYNIPSGTTLLAVEGSSSIPDIEASITPCSFDPAVISLIGGSVQDVEWSNGEEGLSISVESSGTYTAFVTLSSGNTVELTQEVVLSPPPSISVNVTPPLCSNSADGDIELFNVSGIPIESVIWNDKLYGLAIFGLVGGEYSYVVTDINGCQSTGNVTVEAPIALEADLEITEANCPGDLAAAMIEIAGGTAPYELDAMGADFNALETGTYNYQITDSNGCIFESSFDIANPSPWSIELSITDAFDGNNGSAELTISGATAPYTILWSNGSGGTTLENLGQGNYFVLVQDANGCSQQESFSILDLSVENRSNLLTISDLGNGDYLINGLVSEFKLYNNLGQLIDQSNSIVTPLTIRLGALSPGIYYLHVNEGSAKYRLIRR